MRTSQELINFIVENNYKSIASKKWIEKNANLISEILEGDENAVCCFVGLPSGIGHTKYSGLDLHIVSLTTKKVIIAQKNRYQDIIKFIPLDKLKKVTMRSKKVMTTLTFDEENAGFSIQIPEWGNEQINLLMQDLGIRTEYIVSKEQEPTYESTEEHRKAQTVKAEKEKSVVRENKKDNIARCPKCGSTSLSANKKGISITKGIIGGAVAPIGILAGGLGRKKIIITCLNCGNKFKPGK